MKRKKNNWDLTYDLINASPKEKFTMIPTALLRDPTISGKAKSILCLLLSNKKGWKSHVSTLLNFMLEKEEALASGLRELQGYGYFGRLKCKSTTTGKFIGYVWVYTDTRGKINWDKAIKRFEKADVEIVEVIGSFKATPGFSGSGSSGFRFTRGHNNIKYKKNKKVKLHSSGSREPTGKGRNSKLTIAERNIQFKPHARKLAKIIRSYKNLKVTPRQLLEWSNQIRILIEGRGASLARINTALDWYGKHYADPYVPVIESGFSLKEKFGNLEAAIKRSDESFPVKNKVKIKPKIVMKNQLNGAPPGVIKSMVRNLNKAIDMMPECDHLELTKNLCNLYAWVGMNTAKNAETESQEFYDEVGPPEYVVERYIEWLGEQKWVDPKTPEQFNGVRKLFKHFIFEESKVIGRHILTGDYI